MDKPKYVTIHATDSAGDTLITAGDTNPFEEQRQFLLDQLSDLAEKTLTVVAKQALPPSQSEILLSVVAQLEEIEAQLDDNPL